MSRTLIEAAFRGEIRLEDARPAVDQAIADLDTGAARVAEKVDGEWRVNGWLKQAILLYFRLQKMTTFEVGPSNSTTRSRSRRTTRNTEFE
jgi:2,3,4,5-tetrahydropyridine-2-carboxylate N-succinyltransferase